MQRTTTAALFALLLCGLVPSIYAADKAQIPLTPAQPFTISIVNPGGNDEYLTLVDCNSHFDVIIQNTSNKPQKLWSDGCSWGCNNNIYLRVLAVNGKVLAAPLTVTYGFAAFNANSPDPRVVPPHGIIVQEIRLFVDAQEFGEKPGTLLIPSRLYYWQFPVPARGEKETVRMQAVLAIAPDALTKQCGIWTGEVDSELKEYTVDNSMATK